VTQGDAFLISCEHGGNRIPAPYRHLFSGHGAVLRSHRGYDRGALRMARELADALGAPLHACIVSRLLIELNRSPRHPQLYSEFTRSSGAELRRELFECYYLPYRDAVENWINAMTANGLRVVHLSSHSFTPELDGVARDADIGLLYDPRRSGERALCRQWRSALGRHAPALKVRMNYPYAGTADGFTTYLRRRFAGAAYLGIELEINQRHAAPGQAWHALRGAVIASLQEALQEARTEADTGRSA
jgi:predicted N-formylglutamate amidohydrolase